MTKILIIDDEQDLLEEIMMALQYEGYDVVTAVNGKLGVQAALIEHPDLIISDIMMPELDGYGVLKALQQNITTASIPLIFLTAKASIEFIREGMSLGADDYVTKPFTTVTLLAAIETRLERHATFMELSLRNLNQVKKRFAHMVTHELRTPLTGMTMAQQLMQTQGASIPPHEMNDLIEIIARGNQRLTQVIDQVTYYTKVDLGLLTQELISAHCQPVPIWPILIGAVDQARRSFYDGHERKILMVEPDHISAVISDLYSLKHAFGEVINNALKYSDTDSSVIVSQWIEDGALMVQVEDSGVGIHPDKIDSIFDAFNQIDRETSEQQGIGLGLWLANNIVYAHSGKLDINSSLGKGTQVLIQLPLAQIR
jgi:two-component system, sensor histidine kinase and response regulator